MLGGGPGLPISAAQFLAAQDGRERLLKALFLEEAYDVFVQNYADLENTILSVIVDEMVDRHDDRIAIERARRRADRGIANLLSSGRLASDVLERTMFALFGRRSPQAEALAQSIENQSAKLLGYRSMMAFRNYVQHYGLPIQSVTFGAAWVDREQEDLHRLQHRFTIRFSPEALKVDRHVSPQLVADLATLENEKGRVALLPLIREYVDGCSQVHVDMRERIVGVETPWRAAASDLVQMYTSRNGEASYLGLSALALDENGNTISDVPLKIQLEERIEYLRALNGRLSNLRRREIVS